MIVNDGSTLKLSGTLVVRIANRADFVIVARTHGSGRIEGDFAAYNVTTDQSDICNDVSGKCGGNSEEQQ